MNKSDKFKYQKNTKPYLLIMLFIVLNTVYSIFILNGLEAEYPLGLFVMLTILMLLLGFLIAVKVQIYSLFWGYGAMVTGVFQICRIFFTTNNFSGLPSLLLNGVLVLSGIVCIYGGVLSVNNTRLRNQ